MAYTYEIEMRLVVVGEETRRTIDRARWTLDHAHTIAGAEYHYSQITQDLDNHQPYINMISRCTEPRYPHTYAPKEG